MMGKKHNQLLWVGIVFLYLPLATAAAEGRSIWERRVDASQRLTTSDNPWNIQVSSKDGFIIEYSAPKLSPVVVHIQDAHANPPAQTKISLVIRELVEKHRVKLVCVEGADGGFDSTLFDIEKSELKEKTARFFLGEARLTGAEYEWILHSKPGAAFNSDFTLWGIEDQEVYNEHWSVWEKTQQNQKEVTGLAEQILKKIHSDYGKYSSQELLRYEQTAEAFRQGVSGLKEYLEEVSKILQTHPVDMNRYPETKKLLGILSGDQPGAIMAGLTSTGELDHLEQEIRLAL
ncbi:MAG: hypothetical protein HYS56_00475, partial [Candidatus Omnitrophica bacterium]|nr:hypothetical protein [Candidatus Omnitrophota bacterium]